ncbi:HU family DNA-binding protein [Burkholderia ubonensis]|uniref:HU family DNA-binding protein n=1 Tax=Burkholderia ubonensis TaxID=101571 RepID=UPI0039F4C2E5
MLERGRLLNERELIDPVAADTGLSKAAAGEAIQAVLEIITHAVSAGGTVQLVGFGSCHLPAYRSQSASGIKEPGRFRHKGATAFPAYRSQPVFGI